MGDWQPLFYALIVLFIVGISVSQIVGAFENTEIAQNESAVEPYTTFVTSFFDTSLDSCDTSIIFCILEFLGLPLSLIFSFLLPDVAITYIVNSLNAFTYLPDLFSVPLLILITGGIVYGFVALFLP